MSLQLVEASITCLALPLYLPHLTLAGIRWTPSEILNVSSIIDDLISMPIEPFHLVLGRGDDIGQYLETLSEFKIDEPKQKAPPPGSIR